MITLQFCYLVAGLAFGSFAVLSALDRTNRKRFGNAAFWGLFASSFLFGSYLSDWQNGLLVLALIVLGGCGLLGYGRPPTTSPAERRESAERRGNWLFAPALLVPAIALFGTLFLKQVQIGALPLLEVKNVTVISLVLGIVVALAVAMLWLKPRLLAPLQEGRRLADMVGWAIILPQLLASLGAIFALSGVGKAVGEIATRYLPLDQPFEAVIVYCVGMAAFTAAMGNAFAAFPVMTAAIGLPLIVHQFHGNPAIMAAIGMLSGFCGTLTTPMAANFNIVPAALLELPDRNGVIKAQLPTAGLMLIANTLLMYFLVFRF
jgi:uncharacterized membrane protein